MTTYSKETALYDTGTIAGDINEASKTASKYITAIDQSGIKVHAENSVNSNYSQIDATGMTVYQNSNNVASFGSAIRLGAENGARTEIRDNTISMFAANGTKTFDVYTGSSAETVETTKTMTGFRAAMLAGRTYTYTISDTPTTNTNILITVMYVNETADPLEYSFAADTSDAQEQSSLRVEYDKDTKTISIKNNGSGKFDIAIVEYTTSIVPSVMTVSNKFHIQNIELSDLLLDPISHLTTSTLRAYQSRCNGISGGYLLIGKWCYINVGFYMRGSFSANNYWGILDGFPAPELAQEVFPALIYQDSSGAPKAASAYVNLSGRLVIVTGTTGLATDDNVNVSGWYIAQV